MMKSCCFINPPIEDFYYTPIRRQPLGLLYLISALKKAGCEIDLINGHSKKKKIIPLPEQLSYLNEYIRCNDDDTAFPFKDYYHFGLSFQEIKRQIKAATAECFFISSLFTTYYEEVEQIIDIIQAEKPHAKIVVGGYHAALYPEYYLRELNVSYVIAGEGDTAIIQLLDYLNGKTSLHSVQNLIYLKDGLIHRNNLYYEQDLNQFPFPARTYLKNRDFNMYGKKAVSLIASRGCPNKCQFCSSREMWGNSYRKRTANSIINEIDYCVRKYEVEWFNFEDDNLFVSRAQALKLLSALYDYKRKQHPAIQFTAMNGISIEKLDEEIIYLMSQAGFQEINLSLVTKSTSLQKYISRPFHTEKFAEIVTLAKKYQLKVRAYFILGLPEQSKQEIESTIAFLRSFHISMFPSIYYNVKAPKNQWKAQRSSAFFNETEHLSRQDLIYYFNYAHRFNKREKT